MNQILVTEKLYVTPELRRKKKLYKIQFFLCVFFVCILSSYYIYAEYDRNKSEEVSKEILSVIKIENGVASTDNTTIPTDDAIVVLLEDGEDVQGEITQQTPAFDTQYVAENGNIYTVDSILNIPSLGINYVVLSESSEELLKISLNKYWGNGPNEVGNYCIVGHNYKNKKMFGKLSEIQNNAIVELTDVTGTTLKYSVYDRYVVNPTDVSCTSQLTNGKKELTLITCSNYGKQRLIVKAREVK